MSSNSNSNRNSNSTWFGWHYLSNATCLTYGLTCFVTGLLVWYGELNSPQYSRLLKETRVRQVVLDMWFPLRQREVHHRRLCCQAERLSEFLGRVGAKIPLILTTNHPLWQWFPLIPALLRHRGVGLRPHTRVGNGHFCKRSVEFIYHRRLVVSCLQACYTSIKSCKRINIYIYI